MAETRPRKAGKPRAAVRARRRAGACRHWRGGRDAHHRQDPRTPVPRAASVQGWLGDGATWPERAVVLYPPRGTAVSPSTVHVTENGAKASGATVTPLSQAGPADFGLMVVLDQSSSMAGAPTSAALAAVRSLAATRSAGQQIGLVTFASRPKLQMALTADPSTLGRVLSQLPPTHSGADVPSAIKLGLSQLASANVALGAIIVVSDGVGHLTGSGTTTPAAVTASCPGGEHPGLHRRTPGSGGDAGVAAQPGCARLRTVSCQARRPTSPASLQSHLQHRHPRVRRPLAVADPARDSRSRWRPPSPALPAAFRPAIGAPVLRLRPPPPNPLSRSPARSPQPTSRSRNKLSPAPSFATAPAVAAATPAAAIPVATPDLVLEQLLGYPGCGRRSAACC